ncbi:MAG: right-handed parallel beta-helix repeat-containing protein [Thermoplasmata archaeon]
MDCTRALSAFLFATLLISVVGAVVSSEGTAEFKNPMQNIQRLDDYVKGTTHAPIHINGDADFVAQATSEGWSGDGSQNNPYIIAAYDIDGAGGSFCIWIENTNLYFVVKDCNVYNATSSSPIGAGITLNNVTNGKLENNLCNNSKIGVYIYGNSVNNFVVNNTITGNSKHGIYIEYGLSIVIDNNTVSQNSASPWRGKYDFFGIGLYYTNASTITNNTVFNNSFNGIGLLYSNSNTIAKNNISNNGISNGYDIAMEYSDTNTIANNSVNGSFALSYSAHNLIENNNFTSSISVGGDDNIIRNNSASGGSISGNRNIVEGNTIVYSKSTTSSSGAYASGIGIYGTENIVTGNHINVSANTTSSGIASAYAIYVGGLNNTISLNDILVLAETKSSASSYGYGIIVEANNNTISQNQIAVTSKSTGAAGGKPYGYGVFIQGNNTTISQNQIFADVYATNTMLVYSYWVYLNNTFNAKVLYNTINGTIAILYLNSIKGIYMSNSSSSHIVGNTVFRDIYIENSQLIEITSNQLSGDHKYAINLYYTNYSNIVGNILSNISGDSMRIENTNNNTIHGNTIFNSGKIDVLSSVDTIISNNNIHNTTPNGAMISLSQSSRTIIRENTIRDIAVSGGTPISLYASCYNTIDGNEIDNISGNGGNGIFLTMGSHWNTIKNNNISNCNNDGIAIYYSENNTITYNNLCNNSAYGILIYEATNNTVQYNNFYGNNGAGKGVTGPCQASDNKGGNNWNGNYWSNWDGTGAYPIDGGAGASDNSPLVNPVTSELTPLTILVIGLLCILPVLRKKKF